MYRLLTLKIVLLGFAIDATISQVPKINFCPQDFLRIRNKCYYFSGTAETWEDAYWKCADLGSELAVLLNKHQDDVLRNFLSKGYLAHVERWLGGKYDWEKMEWIWAATGKPIYYQQFVSNETSTKSVLKWHCLLIDPANQYRWNSSVCLDKKYFICQSKVQLSRPNRLNITISTNGRNKEIIPLYNNRTSDTGETKPGYYIQVVNADKRPPKKRRNPKRFTCPKNFYLVRKKCYYFGTDFLNWNEAFYRCQDYHSELAVIKNLKLDAKLRASLKRYRLPKKERWIGGLYDWENMAWKWASTGEIVKHEMHEREHLRWYCIVWDPKLHNKWTSASCMKTKQYICQRRATLVKKIPKKSTTVLPIDIQLELHVTNMTTKSPLY